MGLWDYAWVSLRKREVRVAGGSEKTGERVRRDEGGVVMGANRVGPAGLQGEFWLLISVRWFPA